MRIIIGWLIIGIMSLGLATGIVGSVFALRAQRRMLGRIEATRAEIRRGVRQ